MAKKKIEEEISYGVPGMGEAALREAEASIRKMFGEGATYYLDDTEKVERPVFSSGSLSLDYALGIGGFQGGRMVEIFGPPSAGKTTLAINIASQAQVSFPDKRILYVDAENALNKNLMCSLGLSPEKTAVVSLLSAEQNVEATEIMIKSGAFSVAIIDSVAALAPRAQVDGTLEDQFMGLHARLMSRMCQTIKSLASRTNTLLILINQIRFKIGTYGNPETTTGGNAIPFYADVRIRVDGGTSKSSRIVDATSGDTIGHRVKFEVVKNKLASPFRIGEIDLIYGKGFDSYGELVDLGVDMGIIDKGGSWLTYENNKVQGKDKMVELLKSSKDVFDKLKNEVVAVMGHTHEQVSG